MKRTHYIIIIIAIIIIIIRARPVFAPYKFNTSSGRKTNIVNYFEKFPSNLLFSSVSVKLAAIFKRGNLAAPAFINMSNKIHNYCVV